jgi:tetratricopeptide (TPR) repeat protein
MAKAMAAGSYREMGDLATSEQYLKDAYLIIATEHGETHMAACSILNSMGMLYKKQEKFERSKDAYERALSIAEELMGEDHPESMVTRHNLGELHLAMGKKQTAMEYLQKNVDLMEKKNQAQK